MLLPRRVAGPLALALALCGIVLGDAAGFDTGGAAAAPRQVAVPDPTSPARFDSTVARALVDSILHQVSAMRGLAVLRAVQVEVAGRERVRARLEQLTREEQVRSRARGDRSIRSWNSLVFSDLLMVSSSQAGKGKMPPLELQPRCVTILCRSAPRWG